MLIDAFAVGLQIRGVLPPIRISKEPEEPSAIESCNLQIRHGEALPRANCTAAFSAMITRLAMDGGSRTPSDGDKHREVKPVKRIPPDRRLLSRSWTSVQLGGWPQLRHIAFVAMNPNRVFALLMIAALLISACSGTTRTATTSSASSSSAWVECWFEQWRRQCGRLRRLVLWFVGGLGGRRQSATEACSAMSTGQGASLNGFVPFPADNLWNQDISTAAVDPNSSGDHQFHRHERWRASRFRLGALRGSSIGIPYLIVDSQQGPLAINFTAYGDESDPGPMPIPLSAPIEGYPNPGSGDRHVLVIDNGNCWLYELYSSYPQRRGRGAPGSAAVWDLTRRRAASLYVDVRRCRRAADFSWPGALRRSRRRGHRTRAALHAAIEPGRVRAARIALGRKFDQRQCRAHGHAPAAESQLRYLDCFPRRIR